GDDRTVRLWGRPTASGPSSKGTKDLASINTDLEKARSNYKVELEEAKTALLLRYDDLLKSADAAGNRQVSAKIREEMGVFRSDGIIRGSEELRDGILQYGHAAKNARDDLAKAYAEAIMNYANADEPKKAEEIRAELTELAADAPLVSLASTGH